MWLWLGFLSLGRLAPTADNHVVMSSLLFFDELTRLISLLGKLACRDRLVLKDSVLPVLKEVAA